MASLSRSSLRHVHSTTARAATKPASTLSLKHQSSQYLTLRRPPVSALIVHRPLSTSLQRYATHPGNPFDKIDKKHEEAVEHEQLPQHPEEVSSTSSVHEIFHEKGVEEAEKDEDMLAGVKADLVRIPLNVSGGSNGSR